MRDFLHPDRIVVGAFDPADGDAVAALHEGLDAPVVRIDVASAEMVKLAANAFLATRISFINEIANVCELVGADVEDVARGHRPRPAARHALPPAGIGFGGSCFPKDVSFLKLLAGNSGYHFQLALGGDRGERAPETARVAKLQKHLGSLRGKRDRPARARVQAEHRRHARGAEHRARRAAPRRGRGGRGWDPVADARRAPARRRARSTLARGGRGADAAVIVTEWPELRALASAELRGAMRKPLIIDGRNLLDPDACAPPASPTRASAGPARRSQRCPRRAEPEPKLRASRRVEAIILAGGKAERLGDAAGGRPKALVHVAGRPLAAYQVAPLARAGVERVIVSRAPRARGSASSATLAGLGAGDRRRRGAGAARPRRRAPLRARQRAESGDVFALNGDELLDVDFAALLARHRERGAAATITVAQPTSPFGVVDLDDDDVVTRLPGGAAAPVLGQLRRLRPRRRGARAAARARRPRDDDLPGARRRADACARSATRASG